MRLEEPTEEAKTRIQTVLEDYPWGLTAHEIQEQIQEDVATEEGRVGLGDVETWLLWMQREGQVVRELERRYRLTPRPLREEA